MPIFGVIVVHPLERQPKRRRYTNVVFTPKVLLEHEQALYDRPLKLIASKEWKLAGKRLTLIIYGFQRQAHTNPRVRDQYRMAIAHGNKILHNALILHLDKER
jgi:hypothetical protein